MLTSTRTSRVTTGTMKPIPLNGGEGGREGRKEGMKEGGSEGGGGGREGFES